MDYWNHRLFLLHGDAKYIDVMERTLFNGLISGVALDGKTFFYPNPLESRGQHQRSPWFGVACCPGNIARFLPSVPGYVYAKAQDAIYVNLYVQGTGEIALDGNRTVKLTQQTRYPWDGAVKITVAPEPAGTFAINVRIPGWAREEPVPGDLYRFLDTAPPATLKVNGARGAADDRQGLRPALARVAARRHHRARSADARPAPGRAREGDRRRRPRGAAARADRLRRRVARSPRRPRPQPGAAGREPADGEVHAHAAERRDGAAGTRARPRRQTAAAVSPRPTCRSSRFPTRRGPTAVLAR